MASMKRLRFTGRAAICSAVTGFITRLMRSCWPMVHRFVVTQYTNRPAGNLKRMKTKKIGIARMMYFCCLSVCGVSMSSVETSCETT